MARGYYRDQVATASGDVVVGAAVMVATAGTSAPVGFPLYAEDEPSAALLGNPLLTDVQGEYEFWFDAAHEGTYDVLVSAVGYPAVREHIQLVVPGGGAGAVDAEAAARADGDALLQSNIDAEAIARAAADAAHLVAADPHPGYLTQAEADARYVQTGSSVLGVDSQLRAYIQTLMANLDPGGPPPPSP